MGREVGFGVILIHQKQVERTGSPCAVGSDIQTSLLLKWRMRRKTSPSPIRKSSCIRIGLALSAVDHYWASFLEAINIIRV